MLSCFLLKKKKCVKFTSIIFSVIVEQQLASLAEWLGSSCISDHAWVLNLVSTFSDFFSYLRGMLEPGLDRMVHATGSALNRAVQPRFKGFTELPMMLGSWGLKNWIFIRFSVNPVAPPSPVQVLKPWLLSDNAKSKR